MKSSHPVTVAAARSASVAGGVTNDRTARQLAWPCE